MRLIAAACAAAVIGMQGAAGAAQAEAMGGILRLHIMANSDSAADQRAKLAVRDAVLEAMGGMRGCESEAEAEAMLMQSGAQVLRTAEDTLKKCGMEYGAQLVIGEFEFPDRVYAGILYPKGKYRALRIILGEGKGHNWWCVMFPPLCFVDVSSGVVPDSSKELLQNNMSEEDYDLITDDNSSSELTFKFKLVELFENWRLQLASK